MGDVLCEELEDLVHFSVHDLPTRGYVVMEEIRRQGKLCDVTLKVRTDDDSRLKLACQLVARQEEASCGRASRANNMLHRLECYCNDVTGR